MARSQQELLTVINSARAELELMPGFEESYPEHYAKLKEELDRALQEYSLAMASQAPFAPSTQSAPSDATATAPRPPSSNGAAAPKANAVSTPAVPKPRHVASQDTIVVAGRGDRIMLLHWEDEPSTDAAPAPKPKPPAGAAKPPAQQTKPAPSTETPAADQAPPKPQSLQIVKVDADKWKEGYGNFQLRSDTAEAYGKVRDEVLRRGAILTSSGGLRALTAAVGASRSATSFHYTGRALDLYIYSGMVDPKTDPYVVVREKARVYRVYARCSPDQADVTELTQVMTYHKRDGSLTATGAFFDLTALFAEHGFAPIRARESFEGGGAQLGAEWWHFQYERGLVKKKTTFGEDLLAVYSEATLKPTPPWQFRSYVFGVNWN